MVLSLLCINFADNLRKAEDVFLKAANLQRKLDDKNAEICSEDNLEKGEEVEAARVRVQEISNLLPKGAYFKYRLIF